MNKTQRSFQEKNITLDSMIQFLQTPEREKPQIIFPFKDEPKRNPDEIVAKILCVNFLDSTQIRNYHIFTLRDHILKVLSSKDFETIQNGEINEDYFKIVDKIAHGHGIKSKSTNRNENNLTSFATKFCGHHNQKAPFWDNLVSELLNYFGYQSTYRDYRDYVVAFKRLQQENGLMDYSLREIESVMWEVAAK